MESLFYHSNHYWFKKSDVFETYNLKSSVKSLWLFQEMLLWLLNNLLYTSDFKFSCFCLYGKKPGIALEERYCSSKTKQVTSSILVLLMCDTQYSGGGSTLVKAILSFSRWNVKRMKEIKRGWGGINWGRYCRTVLIYSLLQKD